MAKNLIISTLVIIIAVLVGFIIMTNHDWFSQEWLIGLSVIVGGVIAEGIMLYLKIKK
ncbi:MAG: hypothetical protein K5798_06815 [Nitrosopumilus sp.]|uniref:Uncharacterized protein n=1 Tax=Nitrosopumilus zosterae TaxID=718286 RepID=A0A2S2KSE0_9ARCH|nr:MULTISPECIES: hypothetical protein [Nitrosopumilus]MCV0366955.1 hypothetical protein [Nitrosopumilus sp.]BDQ30898.1 hypothetical protein NZOSNM25_001006 [Nitrosopumilus zosterae]GBH34487.1 hypothetical protein NZNM25_12780 [Nitrosopumilus zosterae]